MLLVVLTTGMMSSCLFKKSKSDIDISFTQDTLAIGYTYWWSKNGPFDEHCTNTHSLVFTGTIVDLKEPSNSSGPLYTAQEGLIEIERMYKIKDIGKNIYAEQNFIRTDCFYESGLQKGDLVLVFCYDYENAYSISGKECIIPIDSFDDALVASIRKYIDKDENPIVLKKDMALWEKYGLGEKLKANIECAQEMKVMNAP